MEEICKKMEKTKDGLLLISIVFEIVREEGLLIIEIRVKRLHISSCPKVMIAIGGGKHYNAMMEFKTISRLAVNIGVPSKSITSPFSGSCI